MTGGLEPGEAAPVTARREVAEETGLAGADIEALYDLDQVGSFYAEDAGTIVNSVIFAIRIRPDATPGLSLGARRTATGSTETRRRALVWPPYRESIERIRRLVADPAWAAWFELDGGGLGSPAAPGREPLVDSGPRRQPTVRRHRRAT